jgi:hypothetical protein
MAAQLVQAGHVHRLLSAVSRIQELLGERDLWVSHDRLGGVAVAAGEVG